MEKNYYDILEVNKNASPEVIEKAYKTLVKKYHPDLQTDSSKEKAENKMKELNEAYEILSNTEKRQAYNSKLEESEKKSSSESKEPSHEPKHEEKQSYQEQSFNEQSYQKQKYQEQTYQNNYHENYTQNENINNTNNMQNQQINNQRPSIETDEFEEKLNISGQLYDQMKYEQMRYGEEMKNAINKAYYDAYIQDLKNRGYKIKYKKSKKDYIRILLTVFIIIFILFLLLQIPVIKNYLYSLYKENEIIKTIIDIFTSIINQILNIFKKN